MNAEELNTNPNSTIECYRHNKYHKIVVYHFAPSTLHWIFPPSDRAFSMIYRRTVTLFKLLQKHIAHPPDACGWDNMMEWSGELRGGETKALQ